MHDFPDAVSIGRRFGEKSADVEPSEELLAELRSRLRKLHQAAPELRPEVEFGKTSPLQANIWDRWLARAGDPEVWLKDWIVKGAPLGMDEEIPTVGIFPPVNLDVDEKEPPALADTIR